MIETLELHYRKNFSRLVKKFSYRAGSVQNAEDVVQTAYTRALQYLSSFDEGKSSLDKWFNRILNNSLKHFKNAERGAAHDEFNEENVDGYPDSHYDKSVWREIVTEINSYSDPSKEILVLYFIHGYPPRSIVKVTNDGYKNVVTILDRFKRKMKERYEEEVRS